METADAIEIQLEQGAQAAAAIRLASPKINDDMRDVFGLEKREMAVMATRVPGVKRPDDFIRLVSKLKSRYPVSVGVKIGVRHYVEQDLAVFVAAGVDFVTLDAEGGTHGGPPLSRTMSDFQRSMDWCGRTTVYESMGTLNKMTLSAAGQLTSPAIYLKALALGADAVDIGTMAIVAMLSDQMTKALLGAPPYNLVMHSASHRWNRSFSVDRGAHHLVNYWQSVRDEMCYVVQSLGKLSASDLARTDLVAMTSNFATLVGVPFVGAPMDEGPDNAAFLGHLARRRQMAGRQEPRVQ